MTAPDARVSSLVAEGRLTPEEGARLQRAMQGGGGSRWTLGASPVESVSARVALALALVVILASLALSQMGIRFDGAIDVHRVAGTPSWRTALIDQVVAVPFTATIFWLGGLAAWRRGRWQDFALATAIARAPALLLCAWSLLVVPDMPRPEELVRLSQSGQVPVRLIVSGIGSLPLFVWMIFWLYRGFAHSAGVRGPRSVVVFMIALVVASVLGELAIGALLRL